ncbi:GMC family oxidoreductase N-terminal domain-containing protein [Variovorax sp. J22G21]|uniref:GMC family oxidoreductase n=1 Tax=Variovorax fucosicus TaxID=3053517 RepID=UPI0025780982|nr:MULTISPECIES: GMC family oxidoreductase N-terminal domain-containing protein [unclassified Variovorax]MDM0042199.1 GMC family oxidoreductase N-terminal domain-containing protein [Variovorax sp. J22R193]MDM0060803.1 GMC family oxidoreductase N-terminal domain-containing protein [Variovorax sp. J22G21]
MDFDYVIVGGGSGGATLASRLSEDPSVQVCLIEAGGDGRGILVRAPAAVVLMLPGRPKINNFAFQTVPQPGLNGRRGYQPRGRCLGGSSAINAMLYVRGHRTDYDDWGRLGCEGWSFDDVLPSFKRAEGNQRGESALHGGSGPLQVAEQQSPRPITEAFIQAGIECGLARNDDFNGPEQEGIGLYQVTQFHGGPKNGERCSAAAAYLHPVMNQRPNLHVMSDTQAQRVLLEGRRAVGVEVMRAGVVERIGARREVALCGGAFNSPQLLMLSGIGDPGELVRHGIAVQHVLPGVGQNLQDHTDFVLSYKSGETDLFGIGLAGTVNLVKAIAEWRKTGSGMIATPFAEGGGFIKSSPDLARPDLQLHFVISIVDDHARKLHPGYGFSCHVCVLRPKGRGEVGLHDANAASAPRIDPRFLSHPDDVALLLKGVRRAREIMRAPALARYRRRELYTEGVESDEDLIRHIRSRADTIYHPVGTCRMGTDAMAVVDPQLRVHGIEGLRVVDASVMPTLIGGNTNAPTIMIAERAADWIRAADGARALQQAPAAIRVSPVAPAAAVDAAPDRIPEVARSGS